MGSARRWLLAREGSRPGGGRSKRATEADVEYCFRLLLGRDPDPSGLAYYLDLIDALSVDDLVRRFLNSSEFRRRPLILETVGGEENAIELVACEHFSIYVYTNDQDIGRAIRVNHAYEPHVSTVVEDLVRPGMTFLDLGANVGWFTLLVGSLLRGEGTIHAIEANPNNCRLLTRSLLANGLDEMATVHPIAAGDRTETLLLQPQAGTNGLVNRDSGAAAQVGASPVQALRIDDLLADVERLDLVKVDIEGGEFNALSGMRSLLETWKPDLLMEYSPELLPQVSGSTAAQLVDLCHDLGYLEASIISGSGGVRAVPFDVASLDRSLRDSGSDHLDLHLVAG